MRRRTFLKGALGAGAYLAIGHQEVSATPLEDFPEWIACGDVSSHRAVVTSRSHKDGQMWVEWSTHADFRHARKIQGSLASQASDWTGRTQLEGLPDGQRIFVRSHFTGQDRAPVQGQLFTPPIHPGQPVRFVWGGDVAGQGWGIDPNHDGMLTFASMGAEQPHFFLHSGDTIYADRIVLPQVTLDDGSLWNNLVTPEKSKVAESLADYRGNYRYNLLDKHYREFLAQVPVVVQWDDHEVCNNWEPQAHAQLAANSLKAFHEYWPTIPGPIYRQIPYGPDLDVFVLDLRSYRTPNGSNLEPTDRMLGRTQLDWLKGALLKSRARWKLISGEMPIATYTPKYGLDNWANGPGQPAGRELELAELLGFAKKHNIQNMVWVSADVHYSAAFHFRPEKAQFKDFDPFWEFVAGPLHAGTFMPEAPNDPTFGPEEVFLGVPKGMKPNRPPSEGLQFYGKGQVQGDKLIMTLHRRDGREIFKKVLEARR